MNGPAPWLQSHWDWRAAGNFIGGGSGTGLLIASALLSLMHAVSQAAIALGLLLVAGGLSLVWLELGKPWRFLHVFFHPHTSWMSREASVALPLFAVGLLYLWTGDGVWLWLTAVLAAVFLYCQGRILRAARGIPVWREPRIVSLIVATGLAEGLGLLAMLNGTVQTRAAALPLGLALIVSLGVRAGAWFQYRRRLLAEGAPQQALRAFDRFEPWFIYGGHALPLALLLPTLLPGPVNPAWAAMAGLCTMASGWVLKFVIIRRAAYNQGYAVAQTAARGGGRPGPGCKPGWE